MQNFPDFKFGRAARLLFVLCASLSFIVGSPLQAQQVGTPVPFPSSAISSGIQTVTDSVDRLGIMNFVTAVVAIVALVLVVGVVVFLFRGGLNPVFQLLKDEREARKEERAERRQSQKELAAYRERQAAAEERRLVVSEKNAQVQERLISKMNESENKKEAQEGRDGMVKSVVEQIDEMLDPMRKDLKELNTKVDDGVTLDQIREALQPLQEHLDLIARRAAPTGNTDKLDPKVVADAERLHANGDVPPVPSTEPSV